MSPELLGGSPAVFGGAHVWPRVLGPLRCPAPPAHSCHAQAQAGIQWHRGVPHEGPHAPRPAGCAPFPPPAPRPSRAAYPPRPPQAVKEIKPYVSDHPTRRWRRVADELWHRHRTDASWHACEEAWAALRSRIVKGKSIVPGATEDERDALLDVAKSLIKAEDAFQVRLPPLARPSVHALMCLRASLCVPCVCGGGGGRSRARRLPNPAQDPIPGYPRRSEAGSPAVLTNLCAHPCPQRARRWWGRRRQRSHVCKRSLEMVRMPPSRRPLTSGPLLRSRRC